MKTKCLNPTCKLPARVRGLCWNCYSCATRLIKKRKTTWEALEAAGKALPTGRWGRPGTKESWFLTPADPAEAKMRAYSNGVAEQIAAVEDI